ncbi:MAG: RNA polymerase-binding protein DksA [Candidatus Krumholzibacteriia bacterium]
MAELSSDQLSMFERLLLHQKRQLMDEAGRTVDELTGKEASFADPGDRAAWESESGRDLRIRDRERKLLDKVESALQRIEDGTFGECEECGEMIPLGRLRARPVTTLCIECKEAQETKENKPNHP